MSAQQVLSSCECAWIAPFCGILLIEPDDGPRCEGWRSRISAPPASQVFSEPYVEASSTRVRDAVCRIINDDDDLLTQRKCRGEFWVVVKKREVLVTRERDILR